ncbi:protein kinase [Kamptonema sp. UHCC 0994]|uniref:protein kinase domain-containing protein n=1 Tax=Kamptonema sp. UHCC 0994 TaxID=3031329 RepID=UPI0023B9EDA1|nr:protein kinase [Kamptonema sp. UHCC 0994]MDF0552949.1 protein kinase [Kamptonema sp. UHCC 0994]
MVWVPGQRLYGDRYTIKHKIGEGGFGVTYLAKKAQSEQRVVIKTLKDELLSAPNFTQCRDNFLKEALTLSLCRHPNIVQIDNYFTEGNLPCIAMEYVAGENLWNWVEKRGILSEIEALSYICKVGEALIVVHEKGLLHRDIKPQNIMVRDNHDAVLIDFGLARGFIPDRTQQITFGLTHGFAPPEQYREIGRFGDYTDVYALAATLYYMLTKKPPTAASLRALNHPLKPPFQLNPNISDAVQRAIMKGIEMEATKRPQSVEKWLAMLPQASLRNTGRVIPPKIFSPQLQPQPVKLISAKGVDYNQLDRLLASRKWKEADEETGKKMLEVAGRTSEKNWEFLLQKEGDRRWFPLESGDVEIIEGRYRVVACSMLANAEMEVRITHQLTDEVPSQRRVQKRSTRTNPEGLMVVIPYTSLKPGIWELCCLANLEADSGATSQHTVQLQVLPVETCKV